MRVINKEQNECITIEAYLHFASLIGEQTSEGSGGNMDVASHKPWPCSLDLRSRKVMPLGARFNLRPGIRFRAISIRDELCRTLGDLHLSTPRMDRSLLFDVDFAYRKSDKVDLVFKGYEEPRVGCTSISHCYLAKSVEYYATREKRIRLVTSANGYVVIDVYRYI